MKRFLILLVTACLAVSVNAQTYCYQQTAKVEKATGVKSKGSDKYSYITFSNNKRSCYFSDADGNSTKPTSGTVTTFGYSTGERYDGENYYVYQREENGTYVYMKEVVYSMYVQPNYYMGESGGHYPMYKRRVYLYFSKSYDRMNEWTDPQTYLVQSSASDSQVLKSLRAGYAMGTSAVPASTNTTVFVYEKRDKPADQSNDPVILY